MSMFAEEWVPLAEAIERIARYEREGRPITGLEAARITPDEKVLLPALADFSTCRSDEETWAFARTVLNDLMPPEATHVSIDVE
jgi:hypothetical protein